jgi:hypothetical protein
VNKKKGIVMNADLSELNHLRQMEDDVTAAKGIRADTLRRLLSKVEEFSESHRAKQRIWTAARNEAVFFA